MESQRNMHTCKVSDEQKVTSHLILTLDKVYILKFTNNVYSPCALPIIPCYCTFWWCHTFITLEANLEITGATAQTCSRKSYPLRPWAMKNKLPGAIICYQNAPVVILHKDVMNYRNSYICCELSFVSYFSCFHNKCQRKSVSLCPYFVKFW